MLMYTKKSRFRARRLGHSPDPNNPRVSAEAEILEKGVGTWGGYHIYI